ncbi:39S ribosomal protein L42, mitochondrial [Bombyx mandarina]|uniref:Large ribosomal subunit protein mL42 n=2 Tax=Bombyx TaxID=7090 RepID=A0A8R1WLK1_BOMMO|nr:39S ribosomal protein L42, mitochondrial [Bombyx mori]XP_028032628.1 39S ribosomal protein L42, mitochondrial [Bombyx mandarina]
MSYLTRKIALIPRVALSRFYNKIVITDDGSTIVALHQDYDFPYEHSRALPEETSKDNTVLKMTDLDEVKRVFNEMKPEFARKQLSNLTLTTEHRWYPRARDKKAKKTEMNRPYL